MKTEFNINEANQMRERFNRRDFMGTNLENSGTLSAGKHAGSRSEKTSTPTGSRTHRFSPKFFDECRAPFACDSQPGRAGSNDPEVTIWPPITRSGTARTFC